MGFFEGEKVFFHVRDSFFVALVLGRLLPCCLLYQRTQSFPPLLLFFVMYYRRGVPFAFCLPRFFPFITSFFLGVDLLISILILRRRFMILKIQ